MLPAASGDGRPELVDQLQAAAEQDASGAGWERRLASLVIAQVQTLQHVPWVSW